MVLGKLLVPGCLTDLDNSTVRTTVLSVGASGSCLDIFFSRLSVLSSISLSLGDGPI